MHTEMGISNPTVTRALPNYFKTTATALVWMPTTDEFGAGFGDFEDHQYIATRLAGHFSYSKELDVWTQVMRAGTHLFSSRSLTRRSRFFFAEEVRISADAEEINQNADHIPHNHGSRNNQDAIVDPEDLKDAYDCRHPRVHASTRPTPEHRQQIRQNGKGCSQTGDKAKDVRTLKAGNEDALRVMKKLFTAGEQDH